MRIGVLSEGIMSRKKSVHVLLDFSWNSFYVQLVESKDVEPAGKED